MSHFYTIVLLKKDHVEAKDELDLEAGVNAALEEVMAPYDENMDADPYQRECHCVGWAAKMEARKIADKLFPNDKLHEAQQEWLEENHPEIAGKNRFELDADEGFIWDTHWDEVIKPRDEAMETAYKNHVLFDKPDPECSECKGTGEYESTYNPKSKWDWYRIGGRWDGTLTRTEAESEDGGFNFASKHESIEKNSMAVEDLLKEWDPKKDTPYALVTSDGEWNQRGEMGWWGMSSGEKNPDDWREQVVEILKAHTDCIAVGVDCHI